MKSTNLNSQKKTMNLDMKPPKTKTLRRLLKLMLPYKKKVVFACLMCTFSKWSSINKTIYFKISN